MKYRWYDTSLFCGRSPELLFSNLHFAVWKETKPNFGDKMRLILLNSSQLLVVFVFLLCLSFTFGNKVEDEESCRVYAGGQVYPQERKTSEHALHWSKAQSKSKTLSLICSCRLEEACLKG